MSNWITVAFIIIGSAFALLSALGVARMPDLYTRMQAASKSAALGTGCIMVGVAVYFGELGVTTRAALVIAFLLLTSPLAAHIIGRAAYLQGVPLWHLSVMDDLATDLPAHRQQEAVIAAEEKAKAEADALQADESKLL